MSEPTVRFSRRPVDGPITQAFGGMFSGYAHRGVDFGVPVGTAVIAPADGESVSHTNDGSFGRTVCLKHAGGWYTLYAHLSTALVVTGQRVSAGQIIGMSGNTGMSTGPHLHWQLCDLLTFPTDIAHSRDPLAYMEEEMSAEATRRLDVIEAIVAGNGMQLIPWEDTPGEDSVLGCFPAGTAPTPRDHPDPDATALWLTGAAAIEYCRIRGFSLGLGVGLVRKDLAAHKRELHSRATLPGISHDGQGGNV